MKLKWQYLPVAAVLALAPLAAVSQTIPLLPSSPNFSEPSQIQATINYVIRILNGQVPGQAGGAQVFAAPTLPRNLVENGSMQVQQRGTTARTCGTTSVAATAYSVDRWVCDVNVGSGAGTATPLTSSLPPGFRGGVSLLRASGSLTQPQCIEQELPASVVAAIAGKSVVASAYLKDMGSLTATGKIVTVRLFSGTTADEGIVGVTPTASPATTPAWTGLATNGSANFTVTSAWARYTATPIFIPAAALELGIQFCTTPVGASVANDGFSLTGVQLEVSNGSASAFESRPYQSELVAAQRYFWTLTEPAADVCQGSGYTTATTAARISIPNPITMRIAPTVASIGATLATTTWKVEDAATPVVLATPFLATFTANTVDNITLTATTAGSLTVGRGVLLCGAGGGGILGVSAEF